jgi:hypothetical protein
VNNNIDKLVNEILELLNLYTSTDVKGENRKWQKHGQVMKDPNQTVTLIVSSDYIRIYILNLLTGMLIVYRICNLMWNNTYTQKTNSLQTVHC